MKSTCNSVIYHSQTKTTEENERNIKAAAEVSTLSLKVKTGKITKVVRTKNLWHLDQKAECTHSLWPGTYVPLGTPCTQVPTAPWTTEKSGDIRKEYLSLLSFVQFCLLPVSFSIRFVLSLPSLPTVSLLAVWVSPFNHSRGSETEKKGWGTKGGTAYVRAEFLSKRKSCRRENSNCRTVFSQRSVVLSAN